ncbi:MAG: hypothetical protein KC503_30295 [Myxococcales bacterium]|nr:hypothetical protein [Myxococcales bacterium]
MRLLAENGVGYQRCKGLSSKAKRPVRAAVQRPFYGRCARDLPRARRARNADPIATRTARLDRRAARLLALLVETNSLAVEQSCAPIFRARDSRSAVNFFSLRFVTDDAHASFWPCQ